MAAVICSLELFIPAAGSLKGKRQVVRSVMERIRSRCNAAVAETGHQDVWQRATLEVAMVGSSRAVLEKQVTLMRRIVDDVGEAEMTALAVDYI